MKYFISFIDDYSQYGFIYLIKHKFEALQNFKNYKTKVEKQLEQPIKIINNDRCGEYETFDEFCKGEGIRHIYTMLYKPQQNGIAKRQQNSDGDVKINGGSFGISTHFFGGKLCQLPHIY